MGEWDSHSPSKGGDHGLEGSPPSMVIYALMRYSKGAMVQMAMGSSCNSIAFTALQDVHYISSVVQNRATDSVAKYWSTPKG